MFDNQDIDGDLRALVRDQQELIELLEARLARLEDLAIAGHVAPKPDEPRTPAEPSAMRAPAADLVTDRRHLLSRAATAAAGAVAGGTALAISQASPAAAAAGSFDGNPAVDAVAIPLSGVAIHASTTTGTAFKGEVSSGTVFDGSAAAGTVFSAFFSLGIGFDGSCSNGTILRADIGTDGTHLVLTTDNAVPPPPATIVSRPTGAIVRDASGDLWLCVSGGTPGLWRRMSGPNTAGALTLLAAPVRIYDSRPGNAPGTAPKAPLANGAVRTLDCTNNSSGVPIGAQAVLANVTVVNTSATGFLVAYRNGVSPPAASTINWFQPGSIAANTTVVACDTQARIACFVPPTSSTDFFIDVIGYFR